MHAGHADLDAVEADLAAVERALPRLDDGTYGTCITCGARIDDERLAVNPAAATCPAHDPAPAGGPGLALAPA